LRTLTLEKKEPFWLLWLALAAYAVLVPLSWAVLRPGYLPFDEDRQLSLALAWLEHGQAPWRFGAGCLHRCLVLGLCSLFGPRDACLRFPALAAVLLEPLLLYLALRRSLGGVAALFAALADLLCGATFVRARSVLSPSLLPSVFLAHWLWMGRLRRPWQAALFGLSLSLWALDYEGWVAAALLLALCLLWQQRRRAPMLLAGLSGLALGALFVWMLSRASFSAYSSSRGALSVSQRPWELLWPNLRALLGWEDRALVSAPPMHPFPGSWTWLPLIAGLGLLARRWPLGFAWIAFGALPLGLRFTDAEPHRLCLAYLGLSAAIGLSLAWAWQRPSWRWAAAALLLFGAWDEARAWQAVPAERLRYTYGRSWNERAAADWLAAHEPAGGWELIDGLGPDDDMELRSRLRNAGRRLDGATPILALPWSYAPGLAKEKGQLITVESGAVVPALLFQPDIADAPRWRAIQAQLEPLRRGQLTAPPSETVAVTQAALRDPATSDPWTRTVLWETWLHASLQLNQLEPAAFREGAREPLVSAWYWDAASKRFASVAPELSAQLRQRALRADPRRASLPDPSLEL
jgi:hypothetical protein